MIIFLKFSYKFSHVLQKFFNKCFQVHSFNTLHNKKMKSYTSKNRKLRLTNRSAYYLKYLSIKTIEIRMTCFFFFCFFNLYYVIRSPTQKLDYEDNDPTTGQFEKKINWFVVFADKYGLERTANVNGTRGLRSTTDPDTVTSQFTYNHGIESKST